MHKFNGLVEIFSLYLTLKMSKNHDTNIMMRSIYPQLLFGSVFSSFFSLPSNRFMSQLFFFVCSPRCPAYLNSTGWTIWAVTILMFISRQVSSESSDPAQPDVPFVTTTCPLPTVAIEHIPLFVDLDLPAYGSVRQSLPATCNLYNRTPYSQEVEVTVEPSEAFMFAGQKQVGNGLLCTSKNNCIIKDRVRDSAWRVYCVPHLSA